MDDRTSFDLPSEGRAPDARDKATRRRLIARVAFAALVGALVVWALQLGSLLVVFALASRRGPWLWPVVVFALIAVPAWYLAGGVAARLAGRTDWRPGWLGVGAAWLFALASLVVPPTRVLTPPPGLPVLPPASAQEGAVIFQLHVPGWALLAIVLPLFAYYGDSLTCRLVRTHRDWVARRTKPV